MIELKKRIRNAANGNRNPLVAETYLQEWHTFSKPVNFICTNGVICVVKGIRQNQPPRYLVNDHVVGRVAALLKAPVPEVVFVEITPELLSAETRARHFLPGLAHGTIFIQDCTNREALLHIDKPENRSRFAHLAVLYSWMRAGDYQCIYQKNAPNLVYSVDHGHFFPSGPNWTVNSLEAYTETVMDPWFNSCGLIKTDFENVTQNLNLITDEDVELIVQGPPDAWGISQDERAALSSFLIQRKAKLIEILSK